MASGWSAYGTADTSCRRTPWHGDDVAVMRLGLAFEGQGVWHYVVVVVGRVVGQKQGSNECSAPPSIRGLNQVPPRRCLLNDATFHGRSNEPTSSHAVMDDIISS